MKRPFHFLLIYILFSGFIFSQKVKLKKPISAEDILYLKKEALDLFSLKGTLNMSYHNKDLESRKGMKADVPTNLSSLEIFKKELKGNWEDGNTHIRMAKLYARLNMNTEYEDHFKTGISLINDELKKHPENLSALNSLAGAKMTSREYKNALEIYRHILSIKPDDESALIFIPMIFTFSGQLDSSYYFSNMQITKYPDNYKNYSMLPLYYMYKMFSKLFADENYKDEQYIGPDYESTADLSLLENYYIKNKNSFERELLYYVTKQTMHSSYLIFKAHSDSTFFKHFRFNLPESAKQRLLESEKRFQSYLKRSEIENKYIIYKILGNIYTLLDEHKKAIPYLKKTIQLKTLDQSTFDDNAAEDYDNLAAVYLFSKDTASYQKMIFEKIKIQPGIDPIANDYYTAGHYYLKKNKFAQATSMYLKSLELDKKNANTYLALSVSNWMEGNNKVALSCLDNMYKVDKSKWDLFFIYGLISLQENDVSNSYEVFQKAKQLYGGGLWIDREIINKFYDIPDKEN